MARVRRGRRSPHSLGGLGSSSTATGPALSLAIPLGILALAFLWPSSASGASGSSSTPGRRYPQTVAGRRRFTWDVWDALNASSDTAGLPWLSKTYLVAQAAWESWWGNSVGMDGNNPFNMTAGSYWTGPVLKGPDYEYDSRGNKKSITQLWRVYPSFAAGVQALLPFLKAGGNRYADALYYLRSGDGPAYILALGPGADGCPGTVGCYYTLDAGTYLAETRKIANSVQAALAEPRGG